MYAPTMITRIDAMAISSKINSYFAASATPRIGQVDRGDHDDDDHQQDGTRWPGSPLRWTPGTNPGRARRPGYRWWRSRCSRPAELNPAAIGESGPEPVAGVGAQRAGRDGALGLEADGRRDQHGDDQTDEHRPRRTLACRDEQRERHDRDRDAGRRRREALGEYAPEADGVTFEPVASAAVVDSSATVHLESNGCGHDVLPFFSPVASHDAAPCVT